MDDRTRALAQAHDDETRNRCFQCGRDGVPDHVMKQNLGWCDQCVMDTAHRPRGVRKQA